MENAGGGDDRPSLERAALCFASQHHEGEKEADRGKDAAGSGRRCRPAPESAEDERAAGSQGRRQGEDRRRTRGQAQERSGGDLMATLLVAEHDDKTLNGSTAKAMTAAKALGGEVALLGPGQRCQARAPARLAGAAKVLIAAAARYAHRLAEPVAALIVALAKNYDAIVTPATTSGKNFMPRLAALLDVMQISEVIKVESPDTFQRPIYAGNAIETVQSSDKKKVMTVRTASFQAVGAGGNAPIEPVTAADDPGISSFAGEELSKSDRPELTAARIIISGGRALGSKENFAKYIEPVADRLGAAVGASRAAVDAGYAPNDWQVGQTGKVVAPELYLAIGISGAIQHLAGMKDSKVIVAINKDEEAPIFQVADYGLVADLFQALPELGNELAKK